MPTDSLNTSKPSKATPTTFLTLPREIRQCILSLTYRAPRVLKFDMSIMIARYDNPDPSVIIPRTRLYKRRKMKRWARKLGKVHEIVKEDMGYVRRQWKKQLKRTKAILLIRG
ncbi:Ras-related protein [Venturia nashicola]|uniref:Ras-related protein n=1 Tax=Venturia nashicola TaxID=86259 RepID=A0A4Z1PFB8_9PEZI|nr:Ras-related protein [Venturia nashicola]TLD31972.1 Ras-related protein [Venturia nashicola]